MIQNNKNQIHLFITGQVQGVFFRSQAKQKARSLGITGWIKNLPNGQIEAVAQGDQNKIKQFIDWCEQGPQLAQVEKVEIKTEQYQSEYQDFEVRY